MTRLYSPVVNQHETPLADAVDAFLADTHITPFTTPGHKRAPELADELLRLDLPLSAGADDLHLRDDVLGKAERLAAELWEADYCRFCLNGSTEGTRRSHSPSANPVPARLSRAISTSRSSSASCLPVSSRCGSARTSIL
jgi:hypothetical protein